MLENFNGQTFCFLGRSGAGKDAMVALLHRLLEDRGLKVINIGTGDEGRRLVEKNTVVGRMINGIFQRGETYPDYLAIALWLSVMKEILMGDEVVLMASSPRHQREAEAIDEIMAGGGRSTPIPIFIDVSEEEARRRLLKRGRADDNLNNINKRLGWFDSQIMPIVRWYGDRIVRVDGHGPKAEVFQRFLKLLENDQS